MEQTLITVEILRSQLLEVHESIKKQILSQQVRKSSSRFKANETRKVAVKLNITCIDAQKQEFFVEELSRLYTLAESLKISYDTLSRVYAPSPTQMLEDEQ